MTRPRSLPILLCTLLAGCTVSNDVSYFIVAGKDTTSLSIYRSKTGVNTNIHGGGGSDKYRFSFRKGLTHITGADMTQYDLNDQDNLVDLAGNSQIDLNVTSQGCEISVSVFSKDGRPLPINGTHRAKECGQNVST